MGASFDSDRYILVLYDCACFGIKELNRSIGTGTITKWLRSLLTSVTVCRNRICIAMGCSSIITAASRSRAAA